MTDPRRCAGVVLVRGAPPEVLLIRTRARRFELPKGEVEPSEGLPEAALRELREETGLTSTPRLGAVLEVLSYAYPSRRGPVRKRVTYFLGRDEEPSFGPLPEGVRERRWVGREAVEALPLASENLRPLLRSALAR